MQGSVCLDKGESVCVEVWRVAWLKLFDSKTSAFTSLHWETHQMGTGGPPIGNFVCNLTSYIEVRMNQHCGAKHKLYTYCTLSYSSLIVNHVSYADVNAFCLLTNRPQPTALPKADCFDWKTGGRGTVDISQALDGFPGSCAYNMSPKDFFTSSMKKKPQGGRPSPRRIELSMCSPGHVQICLRYGSPANSIETRCFYQKHRNVCSRRMLQVACTYCAQQTMTNSLFKRVWYNFLFLPPH